jgi:ParB family transcriptional regulator, chromosome partitioning protein
MAIIATLKATENGYNGGAHSIASIPLNKLIAWDGNVRKTGASEGLSELSASIAAHGVLQSLVVRKTNRGKYAVVAGRRRFLALTALAEGGTIASDAPVPCRVIPCSADATEISLTENVVRAPMHPADQFEAFRELIDGGSTPADIAARFGISEVAVKKRLKLARVSPVIFEAYRAGELSLEQVQAFTVSDDHTAQERVFSELSDWSEDPDDIRSALTRDEISATDKRARLVTVTAYEEAGGAVTRDLFAEGDEGIFLLDSSLLDRLAMEKLEAAVESVRAEGWKWVEAHPEFDYEARSQFERRHPESLPLSEEAAAEQKQLSEEYHALFEVMEEDDEESQARLDAIESRINELEDTERAFTPDTLAIAGAVVTIGREGEIDVVRGLVRPEDAPQECTAKKSASSEGKPAISASLIQSLTEQKAAAIGASLAEHPDIALAAVVHALARGVFHTHGNDSSLQIAGKVTHMRESGKGAEAMDQSHSHWSSQIPGDDVALWPWCLSQERDVLLKLLAYCAGRTVNAVQAKQDSPDCRRLTHANALGSALGLDMRDWFTPTADNFFSRVSRTEILSAISEAKGAPAKRSWDKLRKSELATLAEREIAGTGWLPQPLKA